MSLRPLFVTQVYEASLADTPGFDTFNAELAEACRMLAVEDHAGRVWCKAHGYRGYTSYGSLTDLPQRLPQNSCADPQCCRCGDRLSNP